MLPRMKPKTEELLNFLLWSADQLMRPTFRNLTDSYESWAYRNGLLPQVAKLERQQLLECDPKSRADGLYRLTEQGRLHALGGRRSPGPMVAPLGGRWRLGRLRPSQWLVNLLLQVQQRLWPTSAPPFSLQSNANLNGANWTFVTTQPTLVGTNNVVTNAATGAQKFFRLARP